jgi:hypothetical protein
MGERQGGGRAPQAGTAGEGAHTYKAMHCPWGVGFPHATWQSRQLVPLTLPPTPSEASTSRTGTPAWCSLAAAFRPATPAPTTTTSACCAPPAAARTTAALRHAERRWAPLQAAKGLATSRVAEQQAAVVGTTAAILDACIVPWEV